jgi:hypothetical protein
MMVIQSLAQNNIQAIKTSGQEIFGRMSLSRYEQSKKQLDSLTSILTLNVFKYYGLEEQYDSDLKKKVFKESVDFKEKQNLLIKRQQSLIANYYYLDFEPDYYERNNLLKYDLTTKSFSLTNEIYFEEKNKLGYLQFDKMVFSKVSGISVNYHDYSTGGVDFSKGRINFKIADENVALKIEENKSNLKIMYVFNIVNTTEFTNTLLNAWTFKDHLINCKMKYALLYHSQTNEIFWEFKATQ